MSPTKLADPNLTAEELVEFLREAAVRMQKLADDLERYAEEQRGQTRES